MTTLAEQDEVILIKDLRRLGPIDSEIRELAVSAADLIERLRAEREGLRKRIERVEQLIGLTLNTIPKDCGGICTCNRCEIMREVQAALAATHADEAKGESHG